MTGRATCASSKTPSNAPARSPPGRCCTWATCPRNCSSRGLEARRAAAASRRRARNDGWRPELKTLAELEREAILGAIRTLNGDKLQAAKLLGIGKTTLYRKLKEYGIADPLHEE